MLTSNCVYIISENGTQFREKQPKQFNAFGLLFDYLKALQLERIPLICGQHQYISLKSFQVNRGKLAWLSCGKKQRTEWYRVFQEGNINPDVNKTMNELFIGTFNLSAVSGNYNHQCIQTLKGDLNLKIIHCGPGTIISYWSMKYRHPNLTQTLN